MAPFDVVKHLKPLYSPSAKHPSIVEVPDLAFLMVDGRGDPATSEAYVEAIEGLYGVAYTLKFALKKADPERDFKVAPLEGLWWTDADAPSQQPDLTVAHASDDPRHGCDSTEIPYGHTQGEHCDRNEDQGNRHRTRVPP